MLTAYQERLLSRIGEILEPSEKAHDRVIGERPGAPLWYLSQDCHASSDGFGRVDLRITVCAALHVPVKGPKDERKRDVKRPEERQTGQIDAFSLGYTHLTDENFYALSNLILEVRRAPSKMLHQRSLELVVVNHIRGRKDCVQGFATVEWAEYVVEIAL